MVHKRINGLSLKGNNNRGGREELIQRDEI